MLSLFKFECQSLFPSAFLSVWSPAWSSENDHHTTPHWKLGGLFSKMLALLMWAPSTHPWKDDSFSFLLFVFHSPSLSLTPLWFILFLPYSTKVSLMSCLRLPFLPSSPQTIITSCLCLHPCFIWHNLYLNFNLPLHQSPFGFFSQTQQPLL